jgi:hypothetical protein
MNTQITVKRAIKFRAWSRQGDWESDDNRMSFMMIDAEALAFEKYAPLVDCLRDVEDEIYFTQFIGLLDKNETKYAVEILDSTWFTTIIRSEGFRVGGHFRMEPYGPGMAQKKLIWIEPFEKTGYTRKARIL